MKKTNLLVAALITVLTAADAAAQPFVYVLTNGRSFGAGCIKGGTPGVCEPPSILLINTATGTTLRTIHIEEKQTGMTTDLAIAPDGREVYATIGDISGPSRLVIVDTAANAPVATVPVGNRAPAIAVSAQANRAFVPGFSSGSYSVMVVDLTTREVVTTIPVGDLISNATISPDGRDLYVTRWPGSVSRISTASNTVIPTTFVGKYPTAVRVSPDGSHLFVVSGTAGATGIVSGIVSVFDAASGSLLAAIPLPGISLAGKFGMGGQNADIVLISSTTLYVSIASDDYFSPLGSGLFRVDTVSGSAQRLTTKPTFGLAFDAATSRVFATTGTTLDVFDTTTDTQIASIQAGGEPQDVVVASAPGCVYEVTTGRVAFTDAGGSSTLQVAAPAGCAWTLTPSSSSWPRFLDPLSGAGPGTIRFEVPPSATPWHATVSYGANQTLDIDQTIPSMCVELSNGTTTVTPFVLGGWAVDLNEANAPRAGVDVVHVWAWPASGVPPVFVDAATVSAARPDVADIFGPRYLNAGFTVAVRDLAPGTYTLAVSAHSATTRDFNDAAAVTITVRAAAPQIAVDAPAPNAPRRAPFDVFGWAIDPSADAGTGVDVVHVWAYPSSGAPVFVGSAKYGIQRTDVGNVFGHRFDRSGFVVSKVSLPAGSYHLVVYARSTRTGAFSNNAVVPIAVDPAYQDLQMNIDVPAAEATVSTPFVLGGWALDRAAPSGNGIGVVHIWAYPVRGGVPLFVGWAPMNRPRPDVAAVFGHQFISAGFGVTSDALPAGRYDVVFFAQSLLTHTFDIARTVRITVR